MKLKNLIKFNASIKIKLITVSLLLLTIPLVVLGTLSYQKTKTTLDDYGATRLKNSVEMTIEMISVLNEEVEKGTISLEEAQEKVKIAILGEMDNEGVRPINTNYDLGENGYIFVLDQSGTQLAHPNLEGENVWDEEDNNGVKFTQEMIHTGNSEGGLTYYEWVSPDNENQLEPKVTYAKTDPHWDWVINASTYMMDFNKPAYDIQKFILIILGGSVLAGFIIIWLFTNSISRPIRTVTDQMHYLANGDLTQDDIHVTSNDETGQLAGALNDMKIGLRKIIGNVSRASETMTSQSEELTQSAHEVMSGSEQVASTMADLATGAENQADHSSELSSMMGSFVTKVEEANGNGENIQQSTQTVLHLTDKGSQLMNTSTEQMEVIDNIVHDAVEKVEGLDAHSQEISELVLVIQDIAEQTNLLALNAAIEAARAGEHGQGFAVVADEVRKLAEQSSDSVTNITDIVERIQTESSVVSSSLQAGYKEVEQGNEQIITTGKTFEEISTAVHGMVDNINRVSENLSDIVANSEEMNSSIQEIAAVSEESAAGIEETSATTQQASSSMEEVAASSDDLAKLAEELNGLVQQFRL